MQLIRIYIVGREKPISLSVKEVTEGMASGIESFLTFKDAEDRDGRIVVNPETVAAVIITPIGESTSEEEPFPFPR
jgi:hypothetical protein